MKDKQIERLIKAEQKRQRKVVNLIASENYVSKDVLIALGSELTNKYAEGYPGARYYGGNEIADRVENLCRARALKLFKLGSEEWAVNVQPLSGSPANLAVYLALLSPGTSAKVLPSRTVGKGNPPGSILAPVSEPTGTIMGMSLDHGGHLTHGHKVSATGKFWRQVPYGVDRQTEVLDYVELTKLAKRERPQIIVAGYTAYPRIVDWAKFREIADAVDAYLVVDMSHLAGLVAGGAYPSPFPYADVVTTTVHKTLRGPRAAMIFSRKVAARPPAFSASAKVLPSRTVGKVNPPGSTLAPALISDLVDKAVFPGLQGGPHLNQIAATAVALAEAARPEFKKYAKQVVKNARVLAEELARLGWRLISGGTDSHLILVDTWLNGEGLGGQAASERLEKRGIIVNKNTIPFDARKPTDPSGIRLGTAAETTRGRTEKDFVALARRIDQILKSKNDSQS